MESSLLHTDFFLFTNSNLNASFKKYFYVLERRKSKWMRNF